MSSDLAFSQYELHKYSNDPNLHLPTNHNIIRCQIGSRPYWMKPGSSSTCIIYLHGSRNIALNAMFYETRWIETEVTCVFPQAQDVNGQDLVVTPYIDPHYKNVSYGERYWEILDEHPIHSVQFQSDLAYISAIIDTLENKHIYVVGHSNGGVFALLLAIYLPGKIRKIISHQGGIGWEPYFYLDFKRLKPTDYRVPILFLTGSLDVHKEPCEAAYKIFMNEGFDCKLHIEPGMSHKYDSSHEKMMLEWLEE